MAATDNQAPMVLKEGAEAPVTTSSSNPLAFFVILKQGHAAKGEPDQGVVVANQETTIQDVDLAGVPNPVLPVHVEPSSPVNLPAHSVYKGVKVTLDNNNMWNEFYRCKTEMILTKQGRRMFPYCRFRISGLEPFQKYILVMDITPMDSFRYKWAGRGWEFGGRAEPHVLGRVFIHPESPSLGQYWMQNPISFYKLKLTNNTIDQDGHIILHTMHRYLPRLHIVPADKVTEVIQLNGPDVMTFTFPQTEFFAVTAYQNIRITQLKIDYNPFAKGFREESLGYRPKDASDVCVEAPKLIGGLKSLLANSSALRLPRPDREVSPSTDSGILDNGSSPTHTVSPERCSSKKRLQPEDSSEAQQEKSVKVKKRNLNDSPNETHVLKVAIKEEEEEVPAGTPSESALDLSQVKSESFSHPVGEELHLPDNTRQESTLTPSSLTDTSLNGKPALKTNTLPLPQLAEFLKNRTSKLKPILPQPSDTSLDPMPVFSAIQTIVVPDPSQTTRTPSLADSQPSSPLPSNLEHSDILQTPQEATPSPISGVLGYIQESPQPSPIKKKRKSVGKFRRHGRLVKKLDADGAPAIGGPTDVSMQPNLEDVEGLLFVSFTTKAALEIHLGDQPLNPGLNPSHEEAQDSQKPTEIMESETTEEKIARLEPILLQDLKRMRHRQVIHPVLQEVGLKLNLLDHTLAIDLQYLGVRLPLPPPTHCPTDGGAGHLASSPDGALPFVSRTGKTTDVTKIKGWRDKFNLASDVSSSKSEGVDGPLKNRSAFCSDMLDEYLASEGKLIDERAACFTQDPISPVAYQLPTKSTSYVRTLDSVLKKQGPTPLDHSFRFKHTKKSKTGPKPKIPPKCKGKLRSILPAESQPTSTDPPPVNQPLPPITKSATKTTTVSKLQHSSAEAALPKPCVKRPSGSASEKMVTGQDGNPGRNPAVYKSLLKLMELEEGAVWEGHSRTCITEERANIALTSLLTAEGGLKNSQTTVQIIKRRAPPCLNDFCRLGCVCASLAQEHRRFTHCGKAECMFGCTCLKRKVVLVRSPPRKKEGEDDLFFYGALDEEEEYSLKMKKKKKKRMAYTISEPEQESEPALRVRTLWNPKQNDVDPEAVYIPQPLTIQSLPVTSTQQRSPIPIKPKAQAHEVKEDEKVPESRQAEKVMSCARVRGYTLKKAPLSQKSLVCIKQESDLLAPEGPKPVKTQRMVAEFHQGTTTPEPIKRLEILSECSWKKKADRNLVLRVVCERMAQNRLTRPFQVGSYLIRPISPSHTKEGKKAANTCKVCVSTIPEERREECRTFRKGEPEKEAEKMGEVEEEEEEEEEEEDTRKKGMPFLTRVVPSGILTAVKKEPGLPENTLIRVNGKTYPQAKLQLGQMGALHPANRLAAYITGRLQPVRPGRSSVAPAVTRFLKSRPVEISKEAGEASLSNSASETASTVLSIAPSAVASTGLSPVSNSVPCVEATSTSPNHMVAKPTVGKVFTQFVFNKLGSLQQKLPVVSTPQSLGGGRNLALSSASLVMVSPTHSACATQLGLEAQGGAPNSTVVLPISPTSPNTSNVPPSPNSSGTDTPPKTMVSSPPRPARLLLMSGPSSTTSGNQPISPSQKGGRMVLQPVRSTSGTTYYRHPNGHLVQLVPISQLRSVQPNVAGHNTGSFVRRLATVSNSASATGDRTGVTTPSLADPNSSTSSAASDSSSTEDKAAAPWNSSPVTSGVNPALTMATKVTSLSGSSAFNLSSLPSSLKSPPGFLGQTGTYTLRISPGSKEPKVLIMKPPGQVSAPSEAQSSPTGFHLLQIPKSPTAKPFVVVVPKQLGVAADKGKSCMTDTTLPVESTPAELGAAGPSCTIDQLSVVEETASSQQGSPTRPDHKLVLTAEGDVIKGEPDPDFGANHDMPEPQEVRRELEEGEVEGEGGMETSRESVEMSESSGIDSDDDDDDDDSTDTEASEEEPVDIETVEELTEKIVIAQMRAIAMHQEEPKDNVTDEAGDKPKLKVEPTENDVSQEHKLLGLKRKKEEVSNGTDRYLHNETERMRRSGIRERFLKLRDILGFKDMVKASKHFVLEQASTEIQGLVEHNDRLLERKKRLLRQRAAYIKKFSQISGKTYEQIVKKVEEICDKQKLLDTQKTNASPKLEPQSDDNLCVMSGRLNVLPHSRTTFPAHTVSQGDLETSVVLGQQHVALALPEGGRSVLFGTDGSSMVVMVPSDSSAVQARSSGDGVSEARMASTASEPLNIKSLGTDLQTAELDDPQVQNEEQDVSRTLNSFEEADPQGLEEGEILGELSCNGLEASVTTVPEEEEDDEEEEEEDDNKLMSLLNEIVFLNQQIGGDAPSTSPKKPTEDDEERSRSPLFLRLNEEQEPTNGSEKQMQPQTPVPLTPPPLLQMKADPKNGGPVSWRPMPRLVPLGLKPTLLSTPQQRPPSQASPDNKSSSF